MHAENDTLSANVHTYTHGMLDVTVDRDEWLDAFAERYFSEKKPFTMLKKGININVDIVYLLHNAKLIMELFASLKK